MRIDGNARTIRQLLAHTKYKLDYYQREYSWQPKHVTELLDDLSRKFLESYTEGDTLANVSNYKHYFLGSIIISHSDGQRYIVDGQQRLTSLTLLLIRLYRSLENGSLKDQVNQLIYSLSGGIEGFNLDIPEWYDIMEALYEGKSFDESDYSESIQNIALRYGDIENYFEEDYFEIQGEALSSFAYWLLDNVYLVEIAAYDSKDAYAIFETVNDRGLSLTPADMLRGYLLSNIKDTGRRNHASSVWRARSQTLKQIGKGEESEAIKAWLRSRYVGCLDSSESVRDFDAIGSEFHRWVQEREGELGLKPESDSAFANFIERDFEFYASWYYRLRNAANSYKEADDHGLKCVYYNAQHNKFTIQYPILLAPLHPDDSDAENLQKVQIVAEYLDILIYRRIWNLLPIAQRTMADLMPSVIPIIRGKNCKELRDILHKRLQEEVEPFSNNSVFGFQGVSRQKIFLILARMTDYVGVQSEESSRYLEYMKTGKNRYEIEHIWANHPDCRPDELSESEFEDYRNRVGGLLLLPKSDNASSGDDPYDKKLGVYSGQNLLAKSLHEQTYINNPGFRKFREASGLNFKSHSEFKKRDFDDRQELCLRLAEQIWNPERLRLFGGGEPEIAIQPENPRGNQGVEKDNAEHIDLEDKDISNDTKETSAIEPIMNEIREFYKTKSDTTIKRLCARIAELLSVIEKKGWSELTFKPRKLYCAFYSGSNPLFGAFLFEDPRFVIWMDAGDVEKLRHYYEFRYVPSRRQAIYLGGATVAQLQPVLESVYKKSQEY
ncbi:MAG: DUF262 domain-containing protein [Candidatus Poribacteria bacterium]|nr:DUF262 domain-containing protein [Candidatus Poribacteria bacterium]